MKGNTYIGVAGWSLSRSDQLHFAQQGTHLQRYASVFNAAEINSSFYRPHRPSTYDSWAAQVPSSFRFSVKIPKTITHVNRLRDTEALLDPFIGEATSLGARLGCLLIQLPPSFQFDFALCDEFLRALCERYDGEAVWEPRHPSWFDGEADALLASYRIARVAADPACVPAAAVPGGWDGMVYYRLHGSPRMYYSEYATEHVRAMRAHLQVATGRGVDAWCIFDNTALGGALRNALLLRSLTTEVA